MPTWANNPDYTAHATSSKPEEKHKTVMGLFDTPHLIEKIDEEQGSDSSKSKLPVEPINDNAPVDSEEQTSSNLQPNSRVEWETASATSSKEDGSFDELPSARF